MIRFLLKLALVAAVLYLGWTPTTLSTSDKPRELVHAERLAEQEVQLGLAKLELESQVRKYLISKGSPLAEVTGYLLDQKHWRLLIGIAAIESGFCTRKLGLNCWGIMTTDGRVRRFPSLEAGIEYTNGLIERRQAEGRWLTIEAFNCSYVVPCNPNWVKTVTHVTTELNAIVSRTVGTGALDDARLSPSH